MFPYAARAPAFWTISDEASKTGRVKAIVEKFDDQNNCIHEKIKLWCLVSQLKVDVQHLQCLQLDAVSSQLGFGVDATLRLLGRVEFSSKLGNDRFFLESILKPIKSIANQGKLVTFTKDEINYVHEGHDYEVEARCSTDLLDGRIRKSSTTMRNCYVSRKSKSSAYLGVSDESSCQCKSLLCLSSRCCPVTT